MTNRFVGELLDMDDGYFIVPSAGNEPSHFFMHELPEVCLGRPFEAAPGWRDSVRTLIQIRLVEVGHEANLRIAGLHVGAEPEPVRLGVVTSIERVSFTVG